MNGPRRRRCDMPIDQDIREALCQVPGRPPINAVDSTVHEFRRNMEECEFKYDLPEIAMHQERSLNIPRPAGPVPVRIYWPRKLGRDERIPVLIFMHGGAWVFCSMDTHENMLRYLCGKAGVIGVNVGYRLAPEHKFPTALEDCYAVLEWAGKHAELIGGRPDKISVAGDSAGGNLAAVLCLLARDRNGPDIAAQLLFYPSVAAGVLPRYPSWNEYAAGSIQDFEDEISVFLDYYLNSPGELTDYRVSPVLADRHDSLPPALIITAEYDPFRDDGVVYANKLESYGVDVEYKCFAGAVHAFMSLAGGMSRGYEALDYTAEYIRKLTVGG